jgi:hypothetical protein
LIALRFSPVPVLTQVDSVDGEASRLCPTSKVSPPYARWAAKQASTVSNSADPLVTVPFPANVTHSRTHFMRFSLAA